MPRHVNTPEMLEIAVYLGKTIKAARRLKYMKASTLAEFSGVTQQSISHIETGKHLPSLVVLMKIANVLDRPAWTMLRAAENAFAMNATMLADRERRAAHETEKESDNDE